MKKGFTLIELLAVIVILSIISAIAIPIVIKIIDNVKEGSLKVSMSNIEKAVELYINKNQIKENKTFTCSDGVCIDESNNKLEVSGIVPEDGTINITPSGTITYNKLILDGYICDKYNNEFVCNKSSKNIEETKEDSIIIKNTNDSLSNYKIYGNSVQNVTNLYENSIQSNDNLYEKMTFTTGYTVNKTGEIVQNVNYKVSDFIEILPNTTYISKTINNFETSVGTMIRCCCYDENQNFISMLFEDNRFEIGKYKNEFTIPSNAKYIRHSYRMTDTDIQLYKKPLSGIDSLGKSSTNLVESYSIGGSGQYSAALNAKVKLKPNTTYTISFEGTVGNKYYSNEKIFKNYKNFTVKEGITIIKCTTVDNLPQDSTNLNPTKGYLILKNNIDHDKQHVFNKLSIVEGKDYILYDKLGKFYLPLKVNGRNLVDFRNKTYSTNKGVSVNCNEHGKCTTTGTPTIESGYLLTYMVSVDVSLLEVGKVYWTNVNSQQVLKDGTARYGSQFTFTENIKSVNVYLQETVSSFVDGKVYKPILRLAELKGDWEEYINNVINIYMDEPLRKVGNYVDYIDYKNQKEVRNVGVINLSNETNFELIDNYFVLNLESYPKKDEELSISNYLEYGSNFIFEGNKLKIKIEGINTIEELKTWLSNNDVEIYYPLSKSKVSDIELPEIKLNKDYSNIMIESNIKPSNLLIEYN